jgi:hypothetical protein
MTHHEAHKFCSPKASHAQLQPVNLSLNEAVQRVELKFDHLQARLDRILFILEDIQELQRILIMMKELEHD